MDIVAQLTDLREQTLTFFDRPLAELDRSYAPSKWTARQLLHHLADAETVLHDRIRRTISEKKPLIMGFDQDLWCDALQYSTTPLVLNRALFLASRNAVIDLAGRFYLSHGAREYVHNEAGLRTVKMEFDKVAAHNAHHLDQVRRALTPG